MKPFRLNRRAVLRGAGVGVALPWLQAMAPLGSNNAARAAGQKIKRLVVFFTPNGSIRDAWVPTGTETAFELSRVLKPLEPHKADIVVVDGVDNVTAAKGLGDDHMRGMGAMLTGIELLPGTTQGGAGDPAGLAGGISVDQEIVRRLAPMTKFPSLELGVQSGSAGTVWGYSNYRGAGVPLPLDNSPLSVFNRVFTDISAVAGDNSALLRVRAQRKSVLDAVTKNFKALNAKLGTEDRIRLDGHLTAVQELEARILAGGTQMPSVCAKPTAPAIDFKAAANFPAVGKLQMDQMVMALACDLTRVATIQWENSVGGTTFSWLGATRGHHDLSHDGDPTTPADPKYQDLLASKEMLININVWFAEQLAYLIGRMKQIPDQGGTLLDNTLILWCNELARGNAHSHPDMPYVLAGRAGGALKTGRWLKYGQVSHNNLLVSILNAFDVPVSTFGNPAYCTGPLAGLL